jgi:predicted nucleic acid-binding protein
MSYLLDTDIVIDRLQEDPATIQLVTTLAGQGIAISIVTYFEIQQGVLLSPDPVKEQARFDAFLRTQRLLPLSLAVADRCAAIRADLTRRNRRVRQRSLD